MVILWVTASRLVQAPATGEQLCFQCGLDWSPGQERTQGEACARSGCPSCTLPVCSTGPHQQGTCRHNKAQAESVAHTVEDRVFGFRSAPLKVNHE